MISLNLNGKLWANSDNIGKQLIQKLGWTEGEGLGKDKQGSTNHVKVSLKNDRDGIGMKSDAFTHNAGLLQTFDYDMILKNKCAEVNGYQVEEPVQTSMSRPRFGRAVRADYYKPLNNDDWTKIVGKQDNYVKEEKVKKQAAPIDNQQSLFENAESKFVTKKMNISEYFESLMLQKMAKLKGDATLTNQNKRLSSDTELESPATKKSKINESVSDEYEEIKVPKKKTKSDKKAVKCEEVFCEDKVSKRKSKKEKHTTDLEVTSAESIVTEECSDEKVSKKKKKKEKKDSKLEEVIECQEIIVKKEKKHKKRDKNNIEVSFVDQIQQSGMKLSMVDDLLSNEPKEVKREKCVVAVAMVTEMKAEKVGKEGASLARSPLDSSNVGDIKGYKYY